MLCKEPREAAYYDQLFQDANIYMGGCYVNVAEIRYLRLFERALSDAPVENGRFILHLEKDEIIESYFKKALEIKPTNQVALSGYSTYLFYRRQYDKAFEYFRHITDRKHMNRAVDEFCLDHFNTVFHTQCNGCYTCFAKRGRFITKSLIIKYLLKNAAFS